MRFATLLAYASVSSYRDLVESFTFYVESLLLCYRVFYCFHIESNMIHREFRIVWERKSILCLWGWSIAYMRKMSVVITSEVQKPYPLPHPKPQRHQLPLRSVTSFELRVPRTPISRVRHPLWGPYLLDVPLGNLKSKPCRKFPSPWYAYLFYLLTN